LRPISVSEGSFSIAITTSLFFYFFRNAFEETDDAFSPRVLFGKVFAYFEGCGFAALPKAFQIK
jgi:hypothetical protein